MNPLGPQTAAHTAKQDDCQHSWEGLLSETVLLSGLMLQGRHQQVAHFTIGLALGFQQDLHL